MTKYHINKHGVPGPCKAKEGNCPLGGSDSHFSSREEAQEYADKLNEENHGFLPTTKPFEYSSIELTKMEGKQAKVEYDGKTFSGEVIATRNGGEDKGNNGLIIQSKDGQVKHIKTRRLTGLELSGEGRTPMQTGKYLTDRLDKKGIVKEPSLSPNAITGISDLETQVHNNKEFITTEEHDPVKNVQSMFDHVAGKSGKLYRYEEEGNYLETHPYNFEKTMGNHESFLEREEYFNNDYYGDDGDDLKAMYKANLNDHRELHNYTQNLAIEYGKDFEKNVATSGKYSLQDQERIQGEYRKALKDKVSKFVETY